MPAAFAEKACTEKPVSTATVLFGVRTKTCCKLSAGRKTVAEMGCCDLKLPCVSRYSTELLTVLLTASRTDRSADMLKLYLAPGEIFTLKGTDTCTVLKGASAVVLAAADGFELDNQARTHSRGDNLMGCDESCTSRQ